MAPEHDRRSCVNAALRSHPVDMILVRASNPGCSKRDWKKLAKKNGVYMKSGCEASSEDGVTRIYFAVGTGQKISQKKREIVIGIGYMPQKLCRPLRPWG